MYIYIYIYIYIYEICSKNKLNFQILQAMYIQFSFFFILLCCYTCPQYMQTLSAILHFQFVFDRYKSQMCFGVVVDCFLLKKWIKESVLSVSHLMQHLVIHTDSCGCLSSRHQDSKVNDQSWLLHHDNAQLTHHCLFIIFCSITTPYSPGPL